LERLGKKNGPGLASLSKSNGVSTIEAEVPTPAEQVTPKAAARKKIKKQHDSDQKDVNTSSSEDEELGKKHKKVLSKLNKSREKAIRRPDENQVKKQAQESSNDHVHPDRAVQVDLGPIPQPEAVETTTALPTYSTAPEWLRNPITVSDDNRVSFEELGLPKTLLKNLQAQKKHTALPVQSTVLPLLLDTEVEQRDDLCVAAATGSGKTFAYVLPILNSLRDRKRIRLRAVIVVPTRALVKQVIQTLESCSAGFDVRIGGAEGSKIMEEEQRQLIEEQLVYNLDEWKRQQEAPVDWSTFSLEEVVDRAYQKDLLANVGYVTEYSSKVDILVATPGRLVEHLNLTKGFNLDQVQWFVADEADRLLNESYHEWLDAVLPALKSQNATKSRDHVLNYMRLDVPDRRVTKILLSATMTSDISQLMSLELHNPKLVLMENAKVNHETTNQETEVPNTNAQFSLPVRLEEFAVTIKDSEKKPLYLLELLNQHIFKSSLLSRDLGIEATTHDRHSKLNGVVEDTSSSGTSDSDNTSQSSNSESDSDSDSMSSTSSLDSANDDETTSDSSSDSSSSTSSSPTTNTKPNNHLPPPKSLPTNPPPRVLIFTKSTESAHRLSHLLSLLQPTLTPLTATFTRSSPSSTSTSKPNLKKVLASFTTGRTHILISTDLSSRGLDLPNLTHVINYDIPASPQMYIHRVGRTARAGQVGCAWTLVEYKQGKWFWENIGASAEKEKEKGGVGVVIGRIGKVRRVEIVVGEGWKGRYEDALGRLGEDVKGRS